MLVDHSRHNRLLYVRETKATLELDPKSADGLRALLDGSPIGLRNLFEGKEIELAAPRVRSARKKAYENFEDWGLSTLFLTVRSATWTPTDGGRPADSPVLLLPLAVEQRGGTGATAPWKREESWS
ncbi:MAG: DUF4011 domain-containing protein [Myxococcota bacterium]